MKRPGEFEPSINPRATRVNAGTIVVSLGAERLNALLAVTRRTGKALQTPSGIVSGLVDEKIAAQRRQRQLDAMFVPEEHAG